MIKINIDKAKDITHNIRRAKREEEFAPLDAVIMKQIPGKDAVAAEAQRQQIRDKYSLIQNNVNSADSVETLKNIVKELESD